MNKIFISQCCCFLDVVRKQNIYILKTKKTIDLFISKTMQKFVLNVVLYLPKLKVRIKYNLLLLRHVNILSCLQIALHELL